MLSTLTGPPAALAIWLALSFLSEIAEPTPPPSIQELKTEVAKWEWNLAEAKAEWDSEWVLAQARAFLAQARARLAEAEGRRDFAIVEWRKVVSYCQDGYQQQLWRGHSREHLENSRGRLAIARCWLAEAEGKAEVLREELPRVIVFYKGQIKAVQLLHRRGAISAAEAAKDEKYRWQQLWQARKRLYSLERGLSRPSDP